MQKQTYDFAVPKTEIDGFIINDGVVTEYVGPTNVNSITIPLQARIISGNIFKKSFNNPIKVVVTENVKRIENNAFSGTALMGLKIENLQNLEYIGEDIGYNSTQKTVKKNAEKIAFKTASENTTITANSSENIVTFPESINSIEDNCDSDKSKQKSGNFGLYVLYKTCLDFSKTFFMKSIFGIAFSVIMIISLSFAIGLMVGGTLYAATILSIVGFIISVISVITGSVGYKKSKQETISDINIQKL